jgi:selenophosphate synthetase-related protein
MYLTTSYILTTSNKMSSRILNIFNNNGFNANIIGRITKEKALLVSDGKESIKIKI